MSDTTIAATIISGVFAVAGPVCLLILRSIISRESGPTEAQFEVLKASHERLSEDVKSLVDTQNNQLKTLIDLLKTQYEDVE